MRDVWDELEVGVPGVCSWLVAGIAAFHAWLLAVLLLGSFPARTLRRARARPGTGALGRGPRQDRPLPLRVRSFAAYDRLAAMMSPVKLNYDQRVGAASLRLRGDDEDVGTVSSMPIAPPRAEVLGDYDTIVLDLDADGRLVGIEFLVPERQLLPSVLADTEPYGS
jgi:hypothetical protein